MNKGAEKQRSNPVKKFVLPNGMTVLVKEAHHVPKVSIQLWYNVGSKDEKDGERGIAHLIEHMIFKGTQKLSESDINTVVHKLSGTCNAFTSYDYTGYLFNLPKHHWRESLPIMADCMVNCAFNDDMLSSEMKAVVQELKMYRDDFTTTLFEKMISTIFYDHPYHHPIIGYKQDLWAVTPDVLRAFYKKHYVPNNAALVFVGDVDAQEVLELADKYFSSIPAQPTYKKLSNYHNKDLVANTVTVYRDVQQSSIVYMFAVPGISKGSDSALNILSWVLAKGRSSRLYKKLVEELQLVTSIRADSEDLFEFGLFYIFCEPKRIEDRLLIEECIKNELNLLIHQGIDKTEVSRAIKQTQMGIFGLLENFEHQAYQIGKYYWATGDENYVFGYLDKNNDEFLSETMSFIADYIKPSLMHTGMILPLSEEGKEQWHQMQILSDEEDNKILAARIRTTPVEPPKYALNVQVQQPEIFTFPKPTTIVLDNGLTVLYHHNPNTPKIDLIMRFKASDYYDIEDKQGLYNFMTSMLSEGTKAYTAEQLADETEKRGIGFNTYPGGISMSMVKEDLPFAFEILHELIANPIFPVDKIDKVREQILADIRNYWDEPWSFMSQLVRQHIYKGHPYSKNSMGVESVVQNIERADLVDLYRKVITPKGAIIAIVGDLSSYDMTELCKKVFETWQGAVVEDILYPPILDVVPQTITYPINRDQVVVCFAGKSVERKHPDYDALLLFDQIFGGGVLGSMSSRLFELREETGLFYTIKGSLISGSDEQPGMVMVKTIVSLDRLSEAERVIKKTIDSTIDTITQQELEEAKRALINSLPDIFSTNSGIASAFLFLCKYNLNNDFFDTRPADLEAIQLPEVQQAARRVLSTEKMFTLQIGRV